MFRQLLAIPVVCDSANDCDPAEAQLPLWSGQYTVMASLMNCAACALFIPSRFQFGVDVPDRTDVRAWLPAEAPVEHTGAREICVVAPFMRNGDQLIRRAAEDPVFRERRQKLVVRPAGVSDACRQHYGRRGGENGTERIHSHA